MAEIVSEPASQDTERGALHRVWLAEYNCRPVTYLESRAYR